jgi:hypothetical protein
LSSGTRIFPSIVLGTSISFVDVVDIPNEPTGVRVLSVTADGDVYIHNLHNNSSGSDGGQLRLVVQTSLRSVLMSMQQQQQLQRAGPHGSSSGVGSGGDGGAEGGRAHRSSTTVWVERCFLIPESGDVAALLQCEGSEGGDWQVFQFCLQMQSWIRLLDMRGFLCRWARKKTLSIELFTCGVNMWILLLLLLLRRYIF